MGTLVDSSEVAELIDKEVVDAELLTNDINEDNWVYFDKDNKI